MTGAKMLRKSLARRVVYPLQERILGRPTFRYLADLERSQSLPRAAIERLQLEKLHALLRVALDHSPWHAARIRAAGLDGALADGTLTLDDLQRLPSMTREDAREHVDSIRWAAVPGGAFRYNTGGSSGQPLIFYFGRWRQASDAAGRIRARRWWGVELGDREAYLWGAPVELANTDHVKTLRDRLLNQLVLNAFEMSPERMDEYAAALRAFRPKCVYGYASSVALLAAHVRRPRPAVRAAGPPRRLHHRRAALPAPAQTHRGGVRRPRRERVREPRHRLHRARDPGRRHAAHEREHPARGAGRGRKPRCTG